MKKEDEVVTPPRQYRYFLTGRVHPETVVRWFLDLSHHWFDESLGPNAFTGMRETARKYLDGWVQTGELPPAHTQLEIYTSMKFQEWVDADWTIADPIKVMGAAIKAALAYDDAIQRRVVDGEVNLSIPAVGIAQGDDLDALYADWITKARIANALLPKED